MIKTEHILEQGTGRINEDYAIMENNLYGVFDGASSLDNRIFQGNRTGGMIAARTAGRTFARNHFPLLTLAEKANQAIWSKMNLENINPGRRHHLWSTSAAVIRLKNRTIEWLQTGDAHIIFICHDGTFKVLVDREDHDFETLTLLKNNQFKFCDKVKNQIKKTRLQMNRRYGVFNGEPKAMDFINSGFEDISGVSTILLFTDGLHIPDETPRKKHDFSELVELYQKLGLTGLKNHIRKMETQDPDISCYPRFKCHDDIAAIAVHL